MFLRHDGQHGDDKIPRNLCLWICGANCSCGVAGKGCAGGANCTCGKMGAGMMMSGPESCKCGSGGADCSCGRAGGICAAGSNCPCGMMGGNKEAGHMMGGTYYETSAAAGIFGLFAAGSILVIIGIIIWIIAGILLILLLYRKLNTK